MLLCRTLSSFCCKKLPPPEFSIVNNVMDLIYGQALCWYVLPFVKDFEIDMIYNAAALGASY